MAATEPGPEPDGTGLRRKPLLAIRAKLVRVLQSKRSELAPFRGEVGAILDTLDALNRDASGLQRRGHRGESDAD
jgi:hypothetical protein